ncbi:MAG: hypothetical protein Q8P76_00740 [bacterium]|nr:hypothetical protein [bacterium]
MNESFERKTSDIETEASYYEIETDFAPSDLIKGAESLAAAKRKFFPCFYIISKKNYKFYISIYGHFNLLSQVKDTSDIKAGTVKVSGEFKVIDVDKISGSIPGEPSPQDFPLIKEIVQRYLDKIKK